MDQSVKYLCLQATRQGQASYAHVHEIILGLRRFGMKVTLYEPVYDLTLPPPKIWKRIKEFVRVQIRLISDLKPGDSIYVRWHFATILVALWAKIRSYKVVQEVNGPFGDVFVAWPVMRRVERLVVWLMRTQLKLADEVIVVTDQLNRWVETEAGRADSHVIPNGANTDIFNPEAVAALSVDKPYAVFFGALAPWQGVDMFLEAVSNSAWPAEVGLVVAGDGMEREKVELADRAGVIHYLGTLPYQEIAGIVAGSICSLIPKNNLGGRTETGLMPLKLFESMACGVPVVVTDLPGMADVVRSAGAGIVIPEGDANALALAVAYLFHNDNERRIMGTRGAVLAVRDHSWNSRAEQTAQVIAKLDKLK